MSSSSYEYKRFMRDGSVRLITAVVRSRAEGKRQKKAAAKSKKAA